MTSDRCPSCGGAVRPGNPWCTLCWADLRPKPAPPPPPPPTPVPPPAPVPAAVAPAAAPGTFAPGAFAGTFAPGTFATVPATVTVAPPVDPLTAPLAAVLGHPLPAAPVPATEPAEAVEAVTWPCVECGAQNPIELNSCGTCTAPFGGRIARLDDVKGARRRYMVMSLGAVAVFLMLLAALTFASTDASTVDGGDGGATQPDLTVIEEPIDYSTLPEG